MTPLEKLESLEWTKKRAFLALFAGAHHEWSAFKLPNGDEPCPFIGKAECEIDDGWRGFYSRELPGLGFLTFSESPSQPTRDGKRTFTTISIGITDEGHAAREAYWNRPPSS